MSETKQLGGSQGAWGAGEVGVALFASPFSAWKHGGGRAPFLPGDDDDTQRQPVLLGGRAPSGSPWRQAGLPRGLSPAAQFGAQLSVATLVAACTRPGTHGWLLPSSRELPRTCRAGALKRAVRIRAPEQLRGFTAIVVLPERTVWRGLTLSSASRQLAVSPGPSSRSENWLSNR